ncbi:Oxoglutarate/iron-dependent dioxygenase [Trema orientale]|uniref:Oxoglutarate/iron-dependent dioxygenase n=1 Tax=Trema orientale TaxID=63057 RepID=A0A2P5CIY1_TREOI|nr:Oxoglutarate/iron-dependent dioxygenase [Trema orientale]
MSLDKESGWGKSIPVPSVQEIVRNDSQNVPERFVKDHEDRPTEDSFFHSDFPNIPIIDFSLLIKGDAEQLNKLDFACKELGFFQIVNHRVAEEVLSNVRAAVARFFDLSLEEKKKYSMVENDIQGYGQLFVVSEEQKLDWNDMLFLITSPIEYRNMKYWPLGLPGFKKAVEEYSIEVQKVMEELLASLSVLMGMDKNGLKRLHGVMKQSMRMNYYPPCSQPDLVLGLSLHSDVGTLTVILQDGDITGLQVKYEGKWIPVKPIPDSLVVNIADVTEVWSNGMYKSSEHRAVTNANKARMSIATFLYPEDEAEISPVESMMQDRPRMYRNVKQIDYARHRLGKKLDGKANINSLKLEKRA